MAKARLFYTCPISAAYMAKYHGIKFTLGDTLRSACECIGNSGRDGGEFWVANPNIFKPKIGDTIFSHGYDGDLDCGTVIVDIADKLHHAEDDVIMRDGRAFISPKWQVKRTKGCDNV